MKINTSFLTLTALGLLTAAPQLFAADAPTESKAAAVTKAVALLHPTDGSKVEGTITFTKVPDGVKVEGTVTGLTPGKHGFHIHEFGDTTSPDGKAAGGHFNPSNHPHGGLEAEQHHAGDLGNIEADASGNARVDVTSKALAFTGANSILGRGLVVHAGTDDLKSQPSGEAGARAAVGVIGVAKAP